jgi:two-component system KDP operon response regulator KdpE
VPTKPRILIVDADAATVHTVVPVLQRAGFITVATGRGEEGLFFLRDTPPDALLLDLDLPDLDGNVVLDSARLFFSRPILIVSERGDTRQKVAALDQGADDYLQKPFDPAELLARLRAATRNKLTREGAPLVIDTEDLKIDMQRRIVTCRQVEVHLSTREYNLLVELAKGAGRVITHRQLLTAVWGPDRINNVEYLRVFVQQLRQKLERDPSCPRLIVTESGVGYRFVA